MPDPRLHKMHYPLDAVVEDVTEVEPGYLLGSVVLFGTSHFFQAYRIDDDEGEQVPHEVLTEERADELRSIWVTTHPNGAARPVELPGFGGQYFTCIVPHGA